MNKRNWSCSMSGITMLRTAAPLFVLAMLAGYPASVLGQTAPIEGASTVGMAPNREGLGSAEISFAAIDPQMLARDLQTELKRLGCLSGEVDGDWGEKSKTALKSFAHHAKLPIASDVPSMAALDAASAVKERACPLVCDDDMRLVNGRCVAKERKQQKERRARREEPAQEPRRQRAERPSAEPREPANKPLKLCHAGGRQMTVCD
jgi:hypothetical protein